MEQQNEQAQAQEQVQEQVQDAPKTSTTVFLKIDRTLYDRMVAFGSREFIETRLPKMSLEQLKAAEEWVRQRRSEKTKNTYLTFPVSAKAQQDAGKLYLSSMGNFQAAIRVELAARQMDEIFAAPAAEAVAA